MIKSQFQLNKAIKHSKHTILGHYRPSSGMKRHSNGVSVTQDNNWARREKTCLRGFRQSEIQTILYKLKNRNFARSNF